MLARLPSLIRRIGETARAIIAARPDCLVIIDSPDFTHRVARKVRQALPHLPIINYVCPSVWAWKEYRAARMTAYVDGVLAVLPFEPEVMARLGGPPTHYVGHRLVTSPSVIAAREAGARAGRRPCPRGRPSCSCPVPGDRRSTGCCRIAWPRRDLLAARMACRFVFAGRFRIWTGHPPAGVSLRA